MSYGEEVWYLWFWLGRGSVKFYPTTTIVLRVYVCRIFREMFPGYPSKRARYSARCDAPVPPNLVPSVTSTSSSGEGIKVNTNGAQYSILEVKKIIVPTSKSNSDCQSRKQSLILTSGMFRTLLKSSLFSFPSNQLINGTNSTQLGE